MTMTSMDLFVAEAERINESRHADAAWVSGVRRDALRRFRDLGLPTTRDEEWRFTSIAPITETPFVLPANGAAAVRAADVHALQWDGDRSATLVFVNGRYVSAMSDVSGLPPGVRVESLAAAWSDANEAEAHLTRIAPADRRAFAVLNTAFLVDGASVFVPDRTVVPAPIHLVFLSVSEDQPTMTHPRVLVVLGAMSQATVVESYGALRAEGRARSEQAQKYLTNVVTELVAGENATLTHYKIQREHPDSAHVGTMYMRASRDATLSFHSISLGGPR